MNDNEIKAALAEVGAGWLMDSSDEHCQSAAMRHLVDAVEAAERERCAKSLQLLQWAELLIAPLCKDETVWNWLDDTHTVLRIKV